ncbi:hypothetical protein IQ238_12885 [Pleurocapsales cyanobacterium LEGE 06147]|nr:hypothetical protein [Pleurocapsales cyanobacterium LEGE 06147]
MEGNQYINTNKQQITLELPDLVRKQLAKHAELLGLTEAKAIVYILSHYLNNSSFQDKSRYESSSVLTDCKSDDDLPDDEPDEILWDFLESESNPTGLNLQEDRSDSYFLDEPDEIIQEFVEPFRKERRSDG